MKKTLLLLFLASSCIAFSQAPVDGFYKGKGHLDLGLSAGYEMSSKYFAGTDKIALGRDIISASIFAGYGITDRLDVYASVPYVQINKVQGLQDGSLYLKFRAFEKDLEHARISISLAAGGLTNLTDYETEGGSAIGQQAKTLDLRPILHYQCHSGLFFTAQGAYLLKSDPTPSAINAALKVGYAAPSYYLDVWYAYQTSDGGLNYRGDNPIGYSFTELGVDYHKAGLTFYKPFSNKLGGFANASYVLSGRNISQGTGFGIGLVWKAL